MNKPPAGLAALPRSGPSPTIDPAIITLAFRELN